jgi:hypothetical protein
MAMGYRQWLRKWKGRSILDSFATRAARHYWVPMTHAFRKLDLEAWRAYCAGEKRKEDLDLFCIAMVARLQREEKAQ